MNTFKVQKRDMETKAKKLRREGYVTGNLFGKEIEGSVLLKIERNAKMCCHVCCIRRLPSSFSSRIKPRECSVSA